jgi:hypothetical protein
MLLSTQQMNKMLKQTDEIESMINPDGITTLKSAVERLKALIKLHEITVDMVHEYHNALDKIVTMQEIEKATQQ